MEPLPLLPLGAVDPLCPLFPLPLGAPLDAPLGAALPLGAPLCPPLPPLLGLNPLPLPLNPPLLPLPLGPPLPLPLVLGLFFSLSSLLLFIIVSIAFLSFSSNWPWKPSVFVFGSSLDKITSNLGYNFELIISDLNQRFDMPLMLFCFVGKDLV